MFKYLLKKRGPLQRKIIAFTLMCILLICAIFSVTSFYIFESYLRNEIISTVGIGLSNLSESINTEVNEVYRLVRYCRGSNDIPDYIQALEDENYTQVNRVFDRFNEEYQGNSAGGYIIRAVMVTDNHYLQVCPATYSTVKSIPDILEAQEYFEPVINAEDYDYSMGIFDDPFLSGTPKPMVPIIRPIIYKYNSNRIGYVFLELSSSLFTDCLSKYHMEEGDSLLLQLGEHIYLYENRTLQEIGAQTLDSLKYHSTTTLSSGTVVDEIKYSGRKYTLVKNPLKMSGCYVIHAISPSGMQAERYIFFFLFFGVLLMVIAIGLLLTHYMDKHVYKPVNRIHDRISQAATGDFSRDPEIEWNDELGDIGKGINDLSESILKLMENRLADEKEKRELEYQMLQSQINPHFLYNTLNSIKMMAQVQGANGISEMTTSLASLLRSISKGTSLVIPISEELSLVKDYFTIQNYRYGGMIELIINMEDPSVAECSIVKFTLQPLVENAIFHGLEPKGGIGVISINLFYTNTRDICIEVTDNGVGITPEKAAVLLEAHSAESTDFFKEIGISNVNKRIQYEFGNAYGISVESVPGEYTTMKVLLPGENKNVQSSDC